MHVSSKKPSMRGGWAKWRSTTFGCILAGALPALQAADGLGLYLKNCSPCHGKDGKGDTPAGRRLTIPDLTTNATSPERVTQQVREGKKDNRGRQRMPAFKPTLSEAEIAQVVDFVIRFR